MSLRYKSHLYTQKEGKFTHTLQLKTLILIIKDKKQKRCIISSERNSRGKFLFENLSTLDYSQAVRLGRNLFSHDFCLSKKRLYNKMDSLRYESLRNYCTYAPRFTPGPVVVNVSSRVIEPKEIQTLENGPKFPFPPKQVPLADIVSSLESSLHKHYMSISNRDEVRSCFVNTLYGSQKKFKTFATVRKTFKRFLLV